MSKKRKTREKKIARQMQFRFWVAALLCVAVIVILSFVSLRVYQSIPLQNKVLDEEAAALTKEIDGIVVKDKNTPGLERMKESYENLSEEQKSQVTEQRYEKLKEAIQLNDAMGTGKINIVVKDKSKNGFDINFTAEEKAELQAHDGRTAFEGQTDVQGEGADEIFDRLFSGNNNFTIEAELNPNDRDDFNMICSKGDSCMAFRISEKSVYFFIKSGPNSWTGARKTLDETQMHSWIHVAGVYNGNDISTYLEGDGMTTIKNVGPVSASSYPLGIGYCPETGRSSVGSIRKLHIYSQVLTEEQLDEGDYGPDSDNVVLWYDFDDFSYTGMDVIPEGIRCYTDYVQVDKGKKEDIWAEKIPYYAMGEIVFASGNEKIATISRDGTLTGINNGSTYVTASVKGTDFSVKIPVKVGKPLMDFREILKWYVKRMPFVDILAFVLVMFLFVLIQRRQLICYLGKLSEAVAVIGKDSDEVELPDILNDTKNTIREVEESFRKRDDAAREAEKRKNDLVVYLAHDLKTPIASLIGYLTLLRDEKQISPELHQHYVEIALNNSERLDELINEFFDITRFNISSITLNYQEINLTWLLEQLVSEFTPMLAEKELTCSLDVPKNIHIRCDADKMERVFDNLLRNAINYSYRGTEIHIAVTVGEEMTLTCTNCGRTIPEDQLERIFDQFYRLDSARSSSTGGSGLGLAIAKQIVEAHHGTIRAESKEEKIRFAVTIPLCEPGEG